MSLEKQGKYAEAYDAYYKSTWSIDTQAMSFLALAKLKLRNKDYVRALEFLDQSLLSNYHDLEVRALKARTLRLLGKDKEAQDLLDESLKFDASSPVLLFERSKFSDGKRFEEELASFIGSRLNDVFALAQIYLEIGQYQDVLCILKIYHTDSPLKAYYQAYAAAQMGNSKQALRYAQNGAEMSPDYVFPNRLFDVVILEFIQKLNPQDGYAPYYLGNLYYDRRIYDKAIELWEKAVQLNLNYGMVYRNLAIAYYNKRDLSDKARVYLEKAFKLDPSNARLIFELDSLYQKLNLPLKERLKFLKKHRQLVDQRDDSVIQLITLLNETGQYQEAYDTIMNRTFHPLEGGEGKVSSQYEYALVEMAKQDLVDGEVKTAISKLERALVYPRSIGEGKLPIAHDNIIDFYLGLAHKKLGNTNEAVKYFRAATEGLKEPTSMLYYNDQPADAMFYQGLALEQLGEQNKANGKYYKLIDYGEKHVFDIFHADYFAVSLPDALTFDENYQVRNTVYCYYLLGLGYIGLSQFEKAEKMFVEAKQRSNSNQGVIRHFDLKKTDVK